MSIPNSYRDMIRALDMRQLRHESQMEPGPRKADTKDSIGPGYTFRGFVNIRQVPLAVDLDQLYERMITENVAHQDWMLRSRIIREAHRTLHPLIDWLEFQAASNSVQGRREDFIDDTLRFVCTGRREFDIRTWVDLIQDDFMYEAGSVSTRMGRRRAERWKDQLRYHEIDLATSAFISRWLTHRRGFDDMLCTLRIIT